MNAPIGLDSPASTLAVRPAGPDTRRIRLLQIVYDLGVGGLPRVVVTLCRSIDRSRFDVSVLCMRERGALAAELAEIGVPVHCLDRDPKRADYLAFAKVLRHLRRHPVDIVHTHNSEPFIDGGMGAKLAGVRGFVHTDHARAFPDRRRTMLLEHLASRLADRVIGVSEHTTENLARYEHIARHKLVTIPNGIDGAMFDRRIDVTAKRRELGIPARGPLVGIGARLTEQKGVTFLLRAIAALRDRVPDLSALIAGYGPLEADHRREAAELGIAERVHFLGARLDMPAILQVLDAFVLPSVWEGLPMVLLEAMAARRAIVATDVGGVSAAVSHNVNGLLVPPRDPAALANAIEQLVRDAPMRDRFGEAGRRIFEARFSADAMTRRYEALYQEALEGQGR